MRGFALILLCILLVGCAKDVPDMLTEEDVLPPPKVLSLSVSEGQNLASKATISVKFSKEMASASINVSGVSGATVLDPGGKVATFTPSSDMPEGVHTITITGTDKSGRSIESFNPINFNVIANVPPPPEIVHLSLQKGQEIDSNSTITAEFSEKMSWVSMEVSGVSGTTTLDPSSGMSATFTPSSDMTLGDHVLVITGKDMFGQDLKPVSINFTVTSSATISEKSLIAFSSNRDGDYEIYVMRPDGSKVTQLTYNFSDDVQPVWSPNGSLIAFVSDRNGLLAGMGDICLMKPDGVLRINLTNTPAVNETDPFWSSDGKRIGFYSDRLDWPGYYVMDIDGTNLRPINDDEWDDFVFLWQSPDRTMAASVDDSSGNLEIYLDIAGGGSGINLTDNPADDFWPSWSPNGKRIVFVSNRDLNNEIYIMNADGSNQVRLTYDPADDRDPAWAPF